MKPSRSIPVAALACLLVASAAAAQTPPSGQSALPPVKLDLSSLNAYSADRYANPDTPASDAANRTAIDHRFGEAGPTGSLGYLCGIDKLRHDDPQRGGPASSFGREGTFLGAKLSYAFR
jgi:hypothetical protein